MGEAAATAVAAAAAAAKEAEEKEAAEEKARLEAVEVTKESDVANSKALSPLRPNALSPPPSSISPPLQGLSPLKAPFQPLLQPPSSSPVPLALPMSSAAPQDNNTLQKLELESDDVDWARAQLRKRLWEFIRADQGRTVHDAFLLFDRKREGLISRTGFKNGLACDSVALVLTDPCRKRLRQALDRQAGKTICFEDFDFFMQDDWESEEDAKRQGTSVGSSMSSGLLPLQNIEDKPKLARDGALSSGLVPIENDPAEEEKEKKRKKAEKAEKKAKKAKREKEKRVLLEKEAEEKRLQ